MSNKNKDDRFPWVRYAEETKDVDHHPESYEKAIWPLNDKPIKDEPCLAVFKDKYPCREGHRLYVPKMKEAPGMIGLAFQEAFRDGLDMVKEGNLAKLTQLCR
mgnify:CR=1 FL=1